VTAPFGGLLLKDFALSGCPCPRAKGAVCGTVATPKLGVGLRKRVTAQAWHEEARLTNYADCVPNCVVLTVTLQVKAIFAAACKTAPLFTGSAE
jgi:hypothetical protein